MKYGKLPVEEFQKRCKQVFVTNRHDEFLEIKVNRRGTVIIEMREHDYDNLNAPIFHYKPNMSARPEALDYLLGLREDFND